MKTYKTKRITSGNKLEIYKYQKEIYYDYKRYTPKVDTEPQQRILLDNKPEKIHGILERKNKRLKQIGNEIARYIEANISKNSVLMTLTFDSNHYTNLYADVVHSFKTFLLRLKRRIKQKHYEPIQYVARIERGSLNNRLHIHVVWFNYPRLDYDLVTDTWGNGAVNLKWPKSINDATNIGLYFGKYFTKETEDENRWFDHLSETYNKKSFFKSRNLIEPSVEYLEEEYCNSKLQNSIYTSQYTTKRKIFEISYKNPTPLNFEIIEQIKGVHENENTTMKEYYIDDTLHLKIYEKSLIEYYVIKTNLTDEQVKERQQKYNITLPAQI